MSHYMRLIGLASGEPSPLDGKLLKAFDPGRDGVAPDGTPMTAFLEATDDPAEALVFESFRDIHELWTQVDPRQPVRPDGEPNRPLSAYTFQTIQVRESE